MIYFTMLIGLPGSGKSCYAASFRNEDTTILSSDDIRQVLLGSEEAQWNNSLVFNTMNDAAIANLKEGRNVVYDATNLSSKRRMALLDRIDREVKNQIVLREALLFTTSYKVCLKRRTKTCLRKVPREAMERMLKSFEAPYYEEGWDKIVLCNPTNDYDKYSSASFLEFIEKYKDYDQNNPYHNETLGAHVETALKRYQEIYPAETKVNPIILQAIAFHDIGKPFCRVEGEDGYSHYYDHANVGAYFYLSSKHPLFTCRQILHITKLIEWHDVNMTEKALKRRRIEKTFYPVELEIIRMCDKYRKN